MTVGAVPRREGRGKHSSRQQLSSAIAHGNAPERMGLPTRRSEGTLMTANRDLKRRVRDRQAQTGESYMTALHHVLAQRDPSSSSAIPSVVGPQFALS